MSSQFPILPAEEDMQQPNEHPATASPDLSSSLLQIKEALPSIDTKKSESFRKALISYPDLVHTESNPISYLQYCKYDPWKAAIRICAYWELRYEIFGPERCYKPITRYCSVSGALSPITIAIIETGHCYMLLPDNEGRTVVFSQRISRKIHKNYDIKPIHKMELTFYFMHLVAAQPNAITTGFRGVFLLNEKRMYPSVYPSYTELLARISRDCFPVELKSFNVVIAPRITRKTMTPSYSQKLVNSTLPYFWNIMTYQMGFTRLSLDLIQISTDDNKTLYEEKLSKLLIEKLQLNPSSVPTEAGGSWTWQRFKDWIQIQQSILLEQGFDTFPAPILQKPTDEVESRNTAIAPACTEAQRDSQDSTSYVPLDIPQYEQPHGKKVTKRKVSIMPSVDAMAALGVLEPLPIWYAEAAEQSVSVKNAQIPETSSKRQRTT